MHARGEARIFHLGVLQRHTAGKRDSAITRRLPRSLVSSHAVASVALPLYSRPCVDTLNKFVWRRKVSKMRSRALLSVFFFFVFFHFVVGSVRRASSAFDGGSQCDRHFPQVTAYAIKTFILTFVATPKERLRRAPCRPFETKYSSRPTEIIIHALAVTLSFEDAILRGARKTTTLAGSDCWL